MSAGVQLPLFPLDRTCRSCGLTKPLTDFKPRRRSRLGFEQQCRACALAQDKAGRERDLPAHRAKVNARRLHNPAIRERERAYEERERDKRNALRRARRQANAEEVARKKREYRDRDRAAYNAQERERNRRNPEAARARSERWRRSHLAAAAAALKRWFKANPERRALYDRRYREGHPDVLKARKHRQRVLKRGLPLSFTAREWRALCDFYGHRCVCCGAQPARLTADHVVPVSRGGGGEIANVQPLCRHCNSVKHTRSDDYRTPGVSAFLAFLESYPHLRRPRHHVLSSSHTSTVR